MTDSGEAVILVVGVLIVVAACLSASTVLEVWAALPAFARAGLLVAATLGCFIVQAFASPPRWR